MTDANLIGTAVIVYRELERDFEFLILHRAHLGPDFEGDWAWGPPSGHAENGEDAIACAARELFEETRLELDLRDTDLGPQRFRIFVARANQEDAVILSGEHDRFEWADLTTVLVKCKPERVALDFEKVASALA